MASVVVTIWPISPPARLVPLGDGQNSLVYRVEASAGAPCILRVSRNHADADRVHCELAMLAALRDTALPFAVPTPFATRAGALVHQLPMEDGILPGALAVLWTEIAGTHPGEGDGPIQCETTLTPLVCAAISAPSIIPPPRGERGVVRHRGS